MCTLVSPWKTHDTQLTSNPYFDLSLVSNVTYIQLYMYVFFLFAYFSSEDDHTGVGVVKRDEGRGGDVHEGAGYGSRGQGVSRVQVESSLTATEEGRQEGASGELMYFCILRICLCHVQYLSNPDTNRNFPSHTHTARAPLWPSGPGPSWKNKTNSI